jgi:hypothetical protein
MQEVEEKIIISEHRQRRFIDDRNVSQFKMRLHGLMRQHRRFNDCRKAHHGVDAPRLERIPRPPRLWEMTGMNDI